MKNADRLGLRPRLLQGGMGLALVFPAALFGTLVLADYAGPQGWRGLAEFVGWWAICFGVGAGCAFLLSRFADHVPHRNSYLLAALLAATALLLLAIAVAHPDAPTVLKMLFTTALQFTGVASALASTAFFIWVSLKSRKA